MLEERVMPDGADVFKYAVVGGGVVAAALFASGTQALSLGAESTLFFAAVLALGLAVTVLSISNAESGSCADCRESGGRWFENGADADSQRKYGLALASFGAFGYAATAFLALVV